MRWLRDRCEVIPKLKVIHFWLSFWQTLGRKILAIIMLRHQLCQCAIGIYSRFFIFNFPLTLENYTFFVITSSRTVRQINQVIIQNFIEAPLPFGSNSDNGSFKTPATVSLNLCSSSLASELLPLVPFSGDQKVEINGLWLDKIDIVRL